MFGPEVASGGENAAAALHDASCDQESAREAERSIGDFRAADVDSLGHFMFTCELSAPEHRCSEASDCR